MTGRNADRTAVQYLAEIIDAPDIESASKALAGIGYALLYIGDELHRMNETENILDQIARLVVNQDR